jgi:tetratricopeptide (TPR) repeat protein
LFSIGLLLFTSNPISDRISSSKNLKEGSVAARLNIWQAAWEGIKEHPISGYGWENQEKAIGSHYKSDWALFGEVNSASNRAHNLILDAWLCGGILGVIFLLSWYCQFFYLAFSGKKDENIDDYLAWKLLLALSALMYVITLAFGFAVVGTEMYIWFFLAVLSALDARRSISSKPYDLGMPKRLAVLSLLFLGILSLWQSSLEIAIVRADIAFRDMREQLSIKNYPQAISAYQDISFSFDKDPMHAYYLADNLPINSKLVASPLAAQLLQTVAVSLLDQPGNIGLDKYYVEAKIYSFLGNKESAIASIDKAIAIAPEWPKAKFLKASILADMGDYQAAEKYFSETEAVLPPFEEFWPDLERWGKSTEYYRSLAFIGRGDSKLALGDYAGAEIDYKAALRSHPLDISLYKKISNTFFLRNDWQEAIRYNLFGFARQPNEYAWPFAVAILYDKAGNSALAKDYAGKALSLMPAGYSKESPVIKALEEIINKD